MIDEIKSDSLYAYYINGIEEMLNLKMNMRTKLDRFLEIYCRSNCNYFINVMWQVITRYLFNSPSTITEEISRFGLIWFGFWVRYMQIVKDYI